MPALARTSPRFYEKRSVRRRIAMVVTYLGLSVVGITMVLPLVWMLSTALKNEASIYSIPPEWLPSETRHYITLEGEEVEVRLLRKRVKAELVNPSDRGRLLDSVQLDEPGRLDLYEAQLRGGGEKTQAAGIADGLVPVNVVESYSVVKLNAGDPEREKVLRVPSDEVTKRRVLAPQWGNFARAVKSINIGRAYINSIFITLVITAGQVFTSSLAAYAFARLEFPGRDKLFIGYLATMMIPGAVILIPTYIVVRYLPDALNWAFSREAQVFSQDLFLFGKYAVGKAIGIDSYFAVIVPAMFTAYGTFMLRQFFMGIPKDLEDAARIDGCSAIGIYRHVIIPLSKPALATLAVFTFMGSWRAFMWPLIVLNTEDLYPIPVMLRSFQSAYTVEYNLLMAGALVALVPTVIVFMAAQRYFRAGIRLGAIKG